MKYVFTILCVTISANVGGYGQTSPLASKVTNPAEVFEQRIMPIFRSPKPSSCVQCHLASVDLKSYIKPSSAQTFVSLRDQGMIDLDNPSASKILTLIKMGEDDYDKGARLIHKQMRDKEYEAFQSWIVACCNDEKMVKLPASKKSEWAKPHVPDSVIRHSRKGRVLNSFVRNIWSQRLRCSPCHTPAEIKPNAKKLLERFEDFEVQYGDRMTLFKKTPADTMKYWLERSVDTDDEIPLVNLKDPANSLIVLKPTARLPKRVDGKFEPPSYNKPVSHMGGIKMHVNDQSYKSFIAWIEDYAKIKSGEYKSEDQLPSDNWFATKRVLRLKDAPKDWPVGTTVQLMVHRWNEDANSWQENPMAFTQGTVTPRKLVNGALFLLAPTDLEKRLAWFKNRSKFAQGKYLVKVYADLDSRIAKNPTLMLDQKAWVGSIEIPAAKWQPGFPKAESVSGSQLKK